MIRIWEDLTHKMDSQPPKNEVSWGWVLGIYTWVNAPTQTLRQMISFQTSMFFCSYPKKPDPSLE